MLSARFSSKPRSMRASLSALRVAVVLSDSCERVPSSVEKLAIPPHWMLERPVLPTSDVSGTTVLFGPWLPTACTSLERVSSV